MLQQEGPLNPWYSPRVFVRAGVSASALLTLLIVTPLILVDKFGEHDLPYWRAVAGFAEATVFIEAYEARLSHWVVGNNLTGRSRRLLGWRVWMLSLGAAGAGMLGASDSLREPVVSYFFGALVGMILWSCVELVLKHKKIGEDAGCFPWWNVAVADEQLAVEGQQLNAHAVPALSAIDVEPVRDAQDYYASAAVVF